MKFLITGITGFVGPHLANLLLQKGHQVIGLIRSSNGREKDLLDILSVQSIEEIHWIYGDLKNYASLREVFTNHQFDGIFHLAAQSHVPTSFNYPILTFQENVMGTVNLIDLVETTQENCKVHICSTSEVYGDACKNVGILKEEHKLQPVNPYAASKTAIDLYAQERINNGFLKGFVTRAFSHTGPRRGFNFSISSDAYQIAKMLSGKQEKVLLTGNLKTRRVVMDVRDCVNAYYRLMKTKNIKTVYNVCGEDIQEMQFYTNLLLECSGLYGVVQRIHKPFYRDIDIQIQIGDITRLKRDTGWQPTISIKQTMQDLLDYWVRKLK